MRYVQSKNCDKSRLIEVLKIDSIVYDESLTGTFNSISSRYKANKEMFIFAENEDNKVCGYICFFPISDELYKEVLKGDIMFDDNIESKYIKKYSKESVNNIYLISVAINPDNKGEKIGFNLVKEMFSYLSKMSELGYKIEDILATTTSAGGEKLLSKFTFDKIHSYNSKNTLVCRKFNR